MFSLVLIFFPQQMILSSNVSKKKIQFLFRLGLNAMKRLWCNADTQMFRAFSSIKANLHSKKFCFSIDGFVLYLHEVFSFIAIIVPLFKGNACINLGD